MSESKKPSSSTERPRTFWEGARESAKEVQSGPAWMTAGITLNPVHFNTLTPERASVLAGDGTASETVKNG